MKYRKGGKYTLCTAWAVIVSRCSCDKALSFGSIKFASFHSKTNSPRQHSLTSGCPQSGERFLLKMMAGAAVTRTEKSVRIGVRMARRSWCLRMLKRTNRRETTITITTKQQHKVHSVMCNNSGSFVWLDLIRLDRTISIPNWVTTLALALDQCHDGCE